MDNCVFCKIVAGTVSATKEYEDEEVLAFRDIQPEAQTHILLVPKRHLDSLDAASAENQLLLGKLLLAASKLAKSLSIVDYKVVINNGHFQNVPHIHFHLLAGSKKGGI